MSATVVDTMTIEEFLEWSRREENADKFWELEDGTAVEVPPGGDLHGTTCSLIVALMWTFAQKRKRGRVTSNDTGLILQVSPAILRGVDVMFFDEQRAYSAVGTGYPTTLPTVAIEVMSPSDTWARTRRRANQYLEFGVPLVWVVDPIRQTVTVFAPNELHRVLDVTDTLTGNGVLADFHCPVADIFSLPCDPQPAAPTP